MNKNITKEDKIFSMSSNEFGLEDLLKTFRKKKLIILSSSFLVSLIFYFLSFFLNDIYKSEIIISSSSDNQSSILSNYSSLASIAGINLPSQSNTIRADEGIEIIQSLGFFKKILPKYNFKLYLSAAKEWNREKNTLVYDSNIYDSERNNWKSNDVHAINGVPSDQNVHRIFLDSLTVNKDADTGFIKISFKHLSPFVAKEILDLVVQEINGISRDQDILIMYDTIDFLKLELKKNTLNEVRNAIANTIQKQIETIAIANSSPNYLFKILSEPSVPEFKSGPNRVLIFLLSFVLVFLITFLFYLVKELNSKTR